MFRKPRALDEVECRVLGSLLEKEQSTPEYYPLTIAALVAAVNQKTNREPVMALEPDDVQGALDRLFHDVLVWRSPGARSIKWSHNLDRRWGLIPATKAAITLLLLRGEQTAGEIRGRAERLHPFASIDEAEAALHLLAEGDEPLVELLPRAAGQKESRWRHLVAVEPDHTGSAGAAESATAASPERSVEPPSAPAAHPAVPLAERLERLEERVAALEATVRRLSSTG
ncbi:MAG: YceH family protein [Thermoanaerobaculia bacterium]